MKKVYKFLVFLVALFGVAFFILPAHENVYADDSLYFDGEGNLVFSIYDKKATSGIKYKTVGWVIKRYDEAMDYNGQCYGVIPLPEIYYVVEDKGNPGYLYTYFFIQKEDVLSVVEAASAQWRAGLEKYGGIVYLDSVMTVEEYGTALGGLNAQGRDFGEVYYDFEGIKGARGWAQPEYLRAYFDIPVAFPMLEQKKTLVYGDNNTARISRSESIMASASIGSHDISSPEYDISMGIPSGEDLYTYGTANKYYGEGQFIKNTGTVRIPVRVITDYELKWTNSKGESKNETQRVERWYLVEKKYEYYTLDYFDSYRLSEAALSGSAMSPVTEKISVSDRTIYKQLYSGREKHLKISEGSCYAGKISVTSKNRLKPDIPDDNQQALAEQGGASVSVRNDRLIVGGCVILSDAWTEKAVIGTMQGGGTTSFYRTGIIIDEAVANGTYTDTEVIYTYTCGNKTKRVSTKTDSLTVHTPVVSKISLSVPKKYNMAVKPAGNQLVLGTDFSVSAGTFGEHRNIPGYGYRDYGSFAGKKYVRFPFTVSAGGKTYEADTWIELSGTGMVCQLPETVITGRYEIELVVLAGNYPAQMQPVDISMLESNANLDINRYGAVTTMEVEVIGSIYGFCLDNSFYVGNKAGFRRAVPEEAKQLPMAAGTPSETYMLTIQSNGFGAVSSDSIQGKLTYYYIKDGSRQEINLYTGKKHGLIGDTGWEKAPDTVIFSGENKAELSENIYVWETELKLGDNLLALPKDVKADNDKIINQYALRGGNILINFEIYGYCGEMAEYSYINVENSPRGYCNMWKTEGYKYEISDKAGQNMLLQDGDTVLIGIPEKIYEDYEVIGTH